MSAAAGPDLVQDTLILHFDAEYSKSYSCSGTIWRDRSGRDNNGTLTAGPTFNNLSPKYFTFNRITQQQVTSFPLQIANIGTKTICSWIYPTTTSRAGIASTRSPAVQGEGWAFGINRDSIGGIFYFHTGGSVLDIPSNLSLNSWNFVSVTYSQAQTTVIIYLNNNLVGSTSSFTSVGLESPQNGRIGFDGTVGWFGGRIAQLYIYNRALRASEIIQNYNSTKGRFRLT